MQPSSAIDGPAMNGGGASAIAKDAADGNDDDVTEEVFAIARVTWIGERLKVRADGFDIDELGHEQHPCDE